MKKPLKMIIAVVLVVSMAFVTFGKDINKIYSEGEESIIESKFYEVVELLKSGNYEGGLDYIDLVIQRPIDTLEDIGEVEDIIKDTEVINSAEKFSIPYLNLKKSIVKNLSGDAYNTLKKVLFKPYQFSIKKIQKNDNNDYEALIEITMPVKKYYDDMEKKYSENIKSKLGILDAVKNVSKFTGFSFVSDKIGSVQTALKYSILDNTNYDTKTVEKNVKIANDSENYKLEINVNDFIDKSISLDNLRRIGGNLQTESSVVIFKKIGEIRYVGNNEDDEILVNYLLKPMIDMIREQLE